MCCQKCSPTYNYNVHFSTGEMEKSNCSHYVGINADAHCLNLSYGKPLWNTSHPNLWAIAWAQHANYYRQFACASPAESFQISLVEILVKIWIWKVWYERNFNQQTSGMSMARFCKYLRDSSVWKSSQHNLFTHIHAVYTGWKSDKLGLSIKYLVSGLLGIIRTYKKFRIP